jgi:hypothetical protein
MHVDLQLQWTAIVLSRLILTQNFLEQGRPILFLRGARDEEQWLSIFIILRGWITQ